MRLEAMGFRQVYDYVAGKRDWLAAGLPAEGSLAGRLRSGGLARTDPPTCAPETPIGRLGDRTEIDEWGICVVTDVNGVVLGLVTSQQISEVQSDARAEDVMELGPTTIRPSRSLESALETMDELKLDRLPVTNPDGEILGILFREDVESHT